MNEVKRIKQYYQLKDVNQELHKLASNADNYGIIQKSFYECNVYSCGYVANLLTKHLATHKGHQLVAFESTERLNLHHYYGSWVEMYYVRLSDGSKAIYCIPAQLHTLQHLTHVIFNNLKQHKIQARDVNTIDTLMLNEAKRHIRKVSHKKVTKHHIINCLLHSFKPSKPMDIRIPF